MIFTVIQVANSAATDSYIEINERRTLIDKQIGMVTVTRTIAYINDANALQLIRNQEFNIDTSREAVELLGASCQGLSAAGRCKMGDSHLLLTSFQGAPLA